MGTRAKRQRKKFDGSKKKRIVFLCIGVILLIAALIAALFLLRSKPNQKPVSHGTFQETITSFLTTQSSPTVWIVDRDDEQVEYAFLKTTEKKLNECFGQFQNPQDIALRKEIPGKLYLTSFVSSGVSRRAAFSQEQLQFEEGRDLEVTFYGKHTKNNPRIAATIFYDREWKAVFFPAAEFSFPWFCATLFHEISHGKNDKFLHLPSSSAPEFSNIWIQEELDAHRFESALLDEWTKGAYHKSLQEVTQNKKAESTKQLLQSLSFEDLNTLNSLFPKASDMELRIRISQFVIDIIMQWMENKKVPLQEKINAYRELAITR